MTLGPSMWKKPNLSLLNFFLGFFFSFKFGFFFLKKKPNFQICFFFFHFRKKKFEFVFFFSPINLDFFWRSIHSSMAMPFVITPYFVQEKKISSSLWTIVAVSIDDSVWMIGSKLPWNWQNSRHFVGKWIAKFFFIK